MRTGLVIVALLAVLGVARAEPPAITPAQGVEYFEKHIRPILTEHCLACHGPDKQRGELRLDSKASFLKGGTNGALIQTKEPDRSLILAVLSHTGEVKMPPKAKLPEPALEQIKTWVHLGAPYPDDSGKVAGPKSVAEMRASHWSFRPVSTPAVPSITDPWVRTPVDGFILAALRDRKLSPAPAADPRILIRRLYFDLVGLPPTPEEVAEFERIGYERTVDKLLASPAFGERWGRHWLDVARYADTRGYVFEEERRYPFSYTYRDYVIRAFNDDKPYDRFILEQLAADRLDLGADKSPLAAMGFLTLGRRFLNNTPDIIDDRIDVVMRGLQGLTVSCARCHDHKFDPIPTKDYYSLYGVFAASTEPKDLPLLATPAPTPEVQAFEAELARRVQAVDEFREKNKADLAAKNRDTQNKLRALQKKVDEWKTTTAAPPRGMVLQDIDRPGPAQVFLRGNPNNRGPNVPRQFLEVLSADRKPFTQGSGRLELAHAIASPDNPLTARVMVNRVWLHLFGQGFVRTPGDFGTRGEAPTNPELLDWLARRFVADGWSVKSLIRLIVTSNAYRQSSAIRPESDALDPDNRLLSHQNRRRLELEALRDSLLAVGGKLERKMGGPGVDITKAPFPLRRSVYAFVERQNLPGVFRTFDFASPDTTTPQRYITTVPQQALYLLNSPFAVQQAKAFATRPDVASLTDPAVRIQRMYRLAFSRAAEPDEVRLGAAFVQSATWEQYAQVLLLANEFAFVD
jgi:mono/diheme cytochrome c family protein